jgi:hypothetical protein
MSREEEAEARSRREMRAVDEQKETKAVMACRGQRAGAGVERREGRMKGGFKCWQVVGSVLRCAWLVELWTFYAERRFTVCY